MADDPYAVLMQPLAPSAPPPALSSASSEEKDPYDILTKPLIPDPAANVSGYVAAGGRSTWGDIWQGVKAGGHDIAAEGAGALAAVQEPGAPRAATQAFALNQEEAAREAEHGMTPAGQAPGFLKHPLVSTAEAVPGIAAIALPAALSGPAAPFVAGGLMGAQTLGAAQNRAAGQGYELTPTEKAAQFGIGVATGLIPELGLPAKIATTPLVRTALTGVEAGTTFGAGAAGGEAVSQQSEIAAGKRQQYDPAAIVGAGESAIEQGVGIGLLGGIRHGDPVHGKSAPPKGGEANVTRSGTDGHLKPEAQVTAPVDVDTPAAAKAPPPPPPKVDAAQQEALKPAPVVPNITQRVSEPQAATVEQPEVVQPTPPPSPMASEAPPAGDTTSMGVSPQPAQEARPTPVPAPPSEDVGAVLREPDATLQEQHAALTDPNRDKRAARDAIVYPLGVQPLELPRKGGAFGTTALADGRTVQFYKYGPNKLFNADKVKSFDEAGKLNELLGLGPVTKDEAISRTLAGEPGAVVTERTPTGVEAKAAVGTTVTVPEQVEALEASKTPGNTVQVEDPEAAYADRFARVREENKARAAEQVVQPEVVEPTASGEAVTPESKPDPLAGATKLDQSKSGIELHRLPDNTLAVRKPDGTILSVPEGQAKAMFPKAFGETPKIIPAVDKASAEAAREHGRASDLQTYEVRQKELEQERLATAEAAGVKAREHTAKEEQAIVAAANVAADKIAATHAHTGAYDPTGKAIMARARKMVAAANAAKLDIPKTFPEGHPWHPSMLKIREAMDLVRPAKDAEGHTVSQTERLGRFIDREHMIDTNRADEAFAARRDEGKLGLGSPEGAVEIKPKGGAVDEEGRAEEREGAIQEEHPEALAGEGEHEEAPKEEPFTPSETNPIAQKMREEWLAKSPEERAAISRQRNISDLKDELRRLELIQRGKYPDNWKAQAKEKATSIKEKLAEKGASKAEIQEVVDKVHKPYISSLRPTTDTGTKVEVRKNRAVKRSMEEGAPETVLLSDKNHQIQSATPIRSSTAAEAIKEHYDPNAYDKEQNQLNQHLIERVNKLSGDTEVHYLSKEDMDKHFGNGTLGLYDPNLDQIYIRDGARQDTALHETFHAATTKALQDSPEFHGLMQKLRNEVIMGMRKLTLDEHRKLSYAFSDPEEFLTGMMTNPNVQQLLKGVKISEGLAREIGIPRWRKMTAWNAALHVIQKALGLDVRDVSAIEAAMSISEQAMWVHRRGVGDLMEAQGRAVNATREAAPKAPVSLYKTKFSKEQEEGREGGFYRKPADMAESIKNLNVGVVKNFAKELATNTSPKFMKGHLKWLAGNNVEAFHGHLFQDAKGSIIKAINYAREKVSHTYNELRKGDLALRTHAYLLDRKYADRMEDYSKLVGMSVRHNIHADRKAPEPSNAMEHAQRDANWTAAHMLYETLPEPLQRRYREEKEYYANTQAVAGREILRQTLPLFDPPKGSTLKEVMARASKNELTDDDWAHYEAEGADDYIRKATRLMGKKDVYFNSQRDGDFVVSGHYDMPEGGSQIDHSGADLPDDVREFDTKQEAMDYAASTKLPARVSGKTYAVDPNNPGKFLPHIVAEDGRKLAIAKADVASTKYRVQIERQHTEFAKNKAEAQRNRQAMEDAGVKDLTGVMNKRQDSIWGRINTGQQKALERRISSNRKMTEAERDSLQEMTRQMMLAGQNSYSPHMMQRRKVFGADYSTAEGLDSYSRQINQMTARNAHRAELDDALTRMDDHVSKTNISDPDNADRRTAVANEMSNRVYTDAMSPKTSPMMHKIMTYAFTNFLVRPSHILLQQLHPYIYSIPHIAARYGPWQALKAHQQAMKDLGGRGSNLMEGLKASGRVIKSLNEADIDKAVDLAHGADPVSRMIDNLKDADERAAMKTLLETNHLHSAFDASTFAGGGMDRWNSVMRQFTDSMEAINRLSTGLSAYRLEKAQHGHDAGIDYARNMIEHTQGVYSQSNIAPIFKNPILRPFMQFRQQPTNLFIMLAHDAMQAAHGNKEAQRMLSYQLATAFAIGGISGMPTAPLKVGGLASGLLGGPTPSEIDDKFHRTLVDTIGETGASFLENGLPGLAGPYGPSLGPRAGLNPDFLFGSPKSGSTGDMLSYLAGNAIGASGSLFKEGIDGLQDFEQGEYGRAAEKLLPGSARDVFRAMRALNEGVTTKSGQTIKEGSVAAFLTHLAGFSNLKEMEAQEGHYAFEHAIQTQNKGDQLKAKHQSKAKTVLGVPVGKKNAALAAEYGSAYQ